MKLLVLSPSYPTPKTIVYVFVDQLVRAFADKGVDVTVIAPQSVSRMIMHGEPFSRIKDVIMTPKGATFTLYRPLYFSFGNGIFKRLAIKSFRRAVSRTIKKHCIKADVLYGHFWSSIATLLPFAIKFDLPLFGASGEENVSLYDYYTDDEKKDLRSHIKGLISVSSKNRDECISLGLIEESKVRVIPNAVDLRLFRSRIKKDCRAALAIDDSDFVVGFMGQFVSRKGTLRLDEALKKIGDSSVKAMFIGSGVEDPSYDNIIFKGRLNHDAIPQYLTACDVFVLPTENEGCSNAIVEALACGLPVISTDAPFNYDILDNSNSILIDCQNIEQIAHSIQELKNDSVLRQKLSDGAKNKADKLSLEQRAERILTFIKEQL